MAINDTVVVENDAVASGGDLIIDGSTTGTGAVQITELGGGVSADVYREIDVDGDGTFEVSIGIATGLSADWHAQINELRCSSTSNTRIRINNTSGGSGALFAVGYEVDD